MTRKQFEDLESQLQLNPISREDALLLVAEIHWLRNRVIGPLYEAIDSMPIFVHEFVGDPVAYHGCWCFSDDPMIQEGLSS